MIQELNPSGNTIQNPAANRGGPLKHADRVQAGVDKLFNHHQGTSRNEFSSAGLAISPVKSLGSCQK